MHVGRLREWHSLNASIYSYRQRSYTDKGLILEKSSVLKLIQPMIPMSAIYLCSLCENGGDPVRVHHAEVKIDFMTGCTQAN